jgi:hypothetical protein
LFGDVLERMLVPLEMEDGSDKVFDIEIGRGILGGTVGATLDVWVTIKVDVMVMTPAVHDSSGS